MISRKREDCFKANSQHSFWRHPKVSRVKWQKFFPNNKQVLLDFLPCTFIVILERSVNLGPTGPRHSLTMIHLTSLLSFYTDIPLIFHLTLFHFILSFLKDAGKYFIGKRWRTDLLTSHLLHSREQASMKEFTLVPTLHEFMHGTLNSCQQYQSRCLCFYLAPLSQELGHRDSHYFSRPSMLCYKWKSQKTQNTVESSQYKNSPIFPTVRFRQR